MERERRQIIMTFISWATSVLQWFSQKDAIFKDKANLKKFSGTDCFLQLENMKEESLVIVDKHATVKSVVDSVHTARRALKASLCKVSHFFLKSFF